MAGKVNFPLISGYIPFGEFTPDLRLFANDGLVRADNVVPVYGDYITSPAIERIVDASLSTGQVHGLHVDPLSGKGYAAIGQSIIECNEDGTKTDRSGAAYVEDSWMGCSFGSTVIMTNLLNPVQALVSGAGTFANLITSTFAPKAKFCFPFRVNLFLAHLSLGSGYDGLSAGANPTVVAWSQNDVPAKFGSFNANPELRGAGYQPLNFDIGEITGACSGADYAIIAHSNGIVRVDGPPYTFRVVATNYGCLFPYAMCVVGDDTYLWTPAGLGRMRGGVGPIESIGLGKFVRFLVDNATGFSPHPFMTMGLLDNTEPYVAVSMAHDAINNVLFIAYSHFDTLTSSNQPYGKALLAYNISEDRLTWFQVQNGELDAAKNLCLFLRPGRQQPPASWCPGRDIRFLSNSEDSIVADHHYYTKFKLGNSFQTSVLGRGFSQLSKDATTRIRRVRPVYSVTDQAAIGQFSVSIASTNKPYATPVTVGPFTVQDSHGWITTPGTKVADFHAPEFTLANSANVYKNVELQGFEYEAEVHGRYSA